MNKIGKAMLCTALTGAIAVGAAGAADLGTLSPQGAKAYLNQITTLQNQYGKAAARTDDGFSGLLTGLSMAKLVDMDGDGTPELYCGAGSQGPYHRDRCRSVGYCTLRGMRVLRTGFEGIHG